MEFNIFYFKTAILARQAEVVSLMLETIVDSENPKELIRLIEQMRELLRKQTKVNFNKGDPKEYFKDDRIMDGINAIHLAARYHTQSLLLIVQVLHDTEIFESLKDLFEAVDNHMEMTPLHLGIKSTNHQSLVILLTCGVNFEAKDIRGYTPLHVAAKEGNAEHCKVLLKHGANPNAYGYKPDHFKTPLHRANTQDVVRILLKFGANSNAVMIDNEQKFDDSNHDQRLSVLDNYLKRNPQAVEELLNHGITTNGQELDSVNLQICFDFDIFFKEGMKKSCTITDIDEDKALSASMNTDSETLNMSEGSIQYDPKQTLSFLEITKENAVDEMKAHKKIVETGESFLLRHPLAEAYLHLKWQLIRNYYYLNMLFYTLFLIAFTILVVIQEEMYTCRSHIVTLDGLKCGEFGKLVFDDHSNVSYAFNFLEMVYIYWNSDDLWWAGLLFAIFGIFTIIGFVFIIIREICQACMNFKRYITSLENILELTILFGVLGYFISLLTYPLASVHFGAWTVVLSWIEMTYLLGRIPTIGLFIYMAVHVLRTISVFLMIYTPILIAFATAFFILLPNADSFNNYPSAWIKVSQLNISS